MLAQVSSADSTNRVGLWLIGASGNVATTVAMGLALLRRGLIGDVGLLTESGMFDDLELVELGDLVLGGHELHMRSPVEVARELAKQQAFAPHLIEHVADDLADLSGRVRQGIAGVASGGNDGLRQLEIVRGDLNAFVETWSLDRVIVVNLASTEAPMNDEPDDLRAAIADGGSVPASVLYALAAVELGHGYVNFTPSTGASLPAIEGLAAETGAALCGRDGKTGQTLIKSALAPLFAARNLQVRSWFAQNILGNRDGATLTDPGARSSKTRTKGAAVPAILGYQPDDHVGIDYMPSLGDWKVAWDHIVFEGFLGTRMNVQVTWQGADSVLAAPLVIDLARLVDLSMRRGESGVLGHLGLFFKEPIGCGEHSLERQLLLLRAHLELS